MPPETLVAHQVLSGGKPYDDDPDSPVVLLGDSFTGVYQLTDAEHAGVSAHIARGIGYPLDLVMSYGGGPNVRQKLMRRRVTGARQQEAGDLDDDGSRFVQLLGGLGSRWSKP